MSLSITSTCLKYIQGWWAELIPVKLFLVILHRFCNRAGGNDNVYLVRVGLDLSEQAAQPRLWLWVSGHAVAPRSSLLLRVEGSFLRGHSICSSVSSSGCSSGEMWSVLKLTAAQYVSPPGSTEVILNHPYPFNPCSFSPLAALEHSAILVIFLWSSDWFVFAKNMFYGAT